MLRIIQIAIGHINSLGFILLNSKKYDVLYFYNPRLTDTLLAFKLATLLGRKSVVDQTELFSSKKGLKRHKWEELSVAKDSTILFVISKKLESHFANLGTVKMYLLPIMVNFERFAIERKEQTYLLGYIGSFAAKDGINTLLEAINISKKKLPKIKLRLIGYHPNNEIIERSIKKLGIEDNVEITGTVAYSEIPWLLKECDTLIMNRDASEFASFGYPIKLGEYFACRKTVLMSNTKGFSEDFEDGNQVYKYEVNDASSLANAISLRYKNQGEADAVAIRGYGYAKDFFDSKKLGEYMVNILNTI